MAVKCNIASQVLEKIKLDAWGFSKDKSIDRSILFNYAEYLNCEDVVLNPCEDDSNCAKILAGLRTVKKCNMNLIGMTVSIEEEDNEATFFLSAGNIIGGKPPYYYQWYHDESKIELIGSNTEETVKFRPVGDAQINLMVYPIILLVADSEGCADMKTCYYTPSGVKCNNNFDPCYPVENLQVLFNYVECSKTLNLVVSNV